MIKLEIIFFLLARPGRSANYIARGIQRSKSSVLTAIAQMLKSKADSQ